MENLKRIKKYFGDDITEYKIYWDKENKVLRHKPVCVKCGVQVGSCMCFRNLHDAVESVEYTLCAKHFKEWAESEGIDLEDPNVLDYDCDYKGEICKN